MTTSRDQFRQCLVAPEGAGLEFKEARRRYDLQNLLLRELAVEGRAQIIGITRAGRWFAVDSTGQIGSTGDDDPTNAPKTTQ